MINIKIRVKHIIDKYQTRDPVKLAKYMGIHVLYSDLGSVKGYYKSCLGNKFIVINNTLDDFTAEIVAAHELGHALLHSYKYISLLRNSFLYPDNSIYETEANTFAAELLIDDNNIYTGRLNPTSQQGIDALLHIAELKHI